MSKNKFYRPIPKLGGRTKDIDALAENAEILTGQRGNGMDRALTPRDLSTAGIARIIQIGDAVRVVEPAISGDKAQDIADALVDKITNSQLARDLAERVDLIDADGTGLIDRMLVTEGDTGGALTAISGLTQTVGEHTSSIATVESVQAGISAQYMVKLDVNGYVSGFGLYNDGGSSSFIVNADTFAVGKLGEDPEIPFIIGTVDGVTRIALNAATFIPDGTIDNAKIGNTIQSTTLDLANGIGWKIDKNGSIEASSITLRDSAGTIIMQSGVTSASDLLNSSVTANDVGLGNVDNDSTSTIRSGTTAADVGLGNVSNLTPAQIVALTVAADISDLGAFGTVDAISAANIGTYFSGLAVGTAYIANLAVTEGKIGDLAVNTLKIAGNAVTVASNVTGTTRTISSGSGTNCCQGYANPEGGKVLCTFSGEVSGAVDYDGRINIAIGSESATADITMRADSGVDLTTSIPISISVVSNAFTGSNPCNVTLDHVSNGAFTMSNCSLTMMAVKK